MKTHTSIDSIFKSTNQKNEWPMIHSTVEKIIYNICVRLVVAIVVLFIPFCICYISKNGKKLIPKLKELLINNKIRTLKETWQTI